MPAPAEVGASSSEVEPTTVGEAEPVGEVSAVREASSLGSFLGAGLRARPSSAPPAPPSAREHDATGSTAEQEERRPVAHDDTDYEALLGLRPPARTKRRSVSTGAWVLSLAAHAALVGAGAWVVAKATSGGPTETVAAAASRPHDEEAFVTIDLPTMTEATGLTSEAITPPPREQIEAPHASGPESVPRPDASRNGHGGTRAVSAPALNLADRDEAIALTKDLRSRLDRSQVQRLNTSHERASLDDRRATLEPMELTFLVSGKGTFLGRRPLAETDPSRGARRAEAPAVEGTVLGAIPTPEGEGETKRTMGAERTGGVNAAPGQGVMASAAGDDHRSSADATFARPQVTQARPAVPADVAAKPRDNVESEQEVAAAVQSLLHASTAGGVVGEGRGGESGPGVPGSGGDKGPGSSATPLGQNGGALVDLDGSDPRLSDYQRRVKAKIDPLWANAFPKWAALDGRQGRAIIAMTILADGSVTGVSVTRPSGVGEFDENVRRAVLRAAPFGPLPPNLRARSMRWSISFDALNPAVR